MIGWEIAVLLQLGNSLAALPYEAVTYHVLRAFMPHED
jgi:hypothetical protein